MPAKASNYATIFIDGTFTISLQFPWFPFFPEILINEHICKLLLCLVHSRKLRILMMPNLFKVWVIVPGKSRDLIISAKVLLHILYIVPPPHIIDSSLEVNLNRSRSESDGCQIGTGPGVNLATSTPSRSSKPANYSTSLSWCQNLARRRREPVCPEQ